ncbi:hypothetical protein [Desulfotomaculum defluvii]
MTALDGIVIAAAAMDTAGRDASGGPYSGRIQLPIITDSTLRAGRCKGFCIMRSTGEADPKFMLRNGSTAS